MKKTTVEKKSPKKVVNIAPIPEVLPVMAAKELQEIKEEVQKTAPKKESEEDRMNRVIATTVKAVVGEMIPAMMALQQNQSSAGLIHCRICKQAGPGPKPPCNDEHINMVVYPQKYPEFGKFFQGSIINGIRYLSDGRRSRVSVPKACEGQILKQVADFEENERVTMMGRSAQHNSGEMREVGASSTKDAQAAWR